jgi:hypothetical protein
MDLTTALNIATTAAVVGGVIFGARQIRVATPARETQISLQLVEMLQTRDLIEGLSALHDLPEGLSWKELQSQLGERWFSAFAFINALDGLGVLVYRREVSPRVADDHFPSQCRGRLEQIPGGDSRATPDARPGNRLSIPPMAGRKPGRLSRTASAAQTQRLSARDAFDCGAPALT